MKLGELVDRYVAYRKALGEKFITNGAYLQQFRAFTGKDTPIGGITEEAVHGFLYGKIGKVTTGWFVKYTALSGLFRYAVSRNLLQESPLPKVLPKRPEGLVPYIYSPEELKRLFEAALAYQKNRSATDPSMVRIALMLTYMLGLRVHETMSLALGDIDLENKVATIRQSKFHKTRLVPFNMQVKKLLEGYLVWRMAHPFRQDAESALFIDLRGEPFHPGTFRGIFQRIREKAGIKRDNGTAFQPRLHDLRHTFATHRLEEWYRQGKDVQRLLPILSVYLGHTHLAHTTVYLSMTDDLLRAAAEKFEHYAKIRES